MAKVNGWLPILFIIVAVLLGYNGLFTGSNFFAEDDSVTLYNYSHGNAIGNGWRPDKGFGISFFFADPGMNHAWSVFTLWERLIKAPVAAYNMSVVLLLIAAAACQYFFIKRIAPDIGAAAYIIAPLIVFGPLQHEFFFQRHWITLAIGSPLLFMLLHDYFKKPHVLHLLLGGLLLWFTWFFGSFAPFLELIIAGALFAALLWFYFKMDIKRSLFQAMKFYAAAGALTLLLGAWIFYSIFLENRLVGYVREPVYAMQAGWVDMISALTFIINFFHAGWLMNGALLAELSNLPTISWTNCSVIFPIIFIYFLFRRPDNFWEFSIKWMLIIFYLNEFLISLFPAYLNVLQYIVNGYPLEKFQPVYHVLQVGAIGIFISKISKGRSMKVSAIAGNVGKAVAFLLLIFYAALAIFSFVSIISPGTVCGSVMMAAQKIPPCGIGAYPKDLLLAIAAFNIESIMRSMNWAVFAFYSLSALIMASFISKWSAAFYKSRTVIASVLLINGILLSWAIYPLNKSPLIWDQKSLKGFLSAVKPTDRLYNFIDEGQKTKKSLSSFRENWYNKDGSRKVPARGNLLTPALNLSGVKSFCQRDVAEFEYRIFNAGGVKRIASLRGIDAGPLIQSAQLEEGAVTYYYSFRRLDQVPGYLAPVAEANQLFIYKNLHARPYFYAADGADISLKDFAYGRLVFDYHGDKESTVTIRDAWHPFWKAKMDGIDLPVIRSDGIFKSIRLPGGSHSVTIYFDTAPFKAGIYISIVAWAMFLCAVCILAVKTRQKREGSWNIR